jgi:hypothetical protein
MSSLERTLEERRQWREQKAEFFKQEQRRDTKVIERCEVGWKHLADAIHHTIVRHNSLGKAMLGIRRPAGALEIHRAGQLPSLLTLTLDVENAQIVYRSPLHEGSAILDGEGTISAPFFGAVFLVNPEGRVIKFRYEEAAQYLLAPILHS